VSNRNEIFGIHRTTIIVIAVAITFGGFSVYKALEGEPANIARPERSDVPAISNLGTAVLTKAEAPRPAVKTTLTPIEQIEVGDRVLAESPSGEEDTAFGSEIIPSDWRKLTLRAPKRDGTTAEVVLLRPLTWLNEQHGEVGGTVFISVPECGIDGNANVLAIDPCPEIRPGGGRVVTGTFLHQARSTISLTIAGQSEPIECTGNHPFWSEDRQAFVRADSLQPNETLRTATGLTTVESWTPVLNPTPVYNIEVHGAHVYHVGTSGVVVHNGTGLPILDNCPWKVAPKHWPPTIADGDLMHGAFEGWLRDRFPNTEFKFRVNPHEPGVDVDWINSPGSVNPGFIHAEFKPFTSSGLASFQGQLGNWGLNDIALFTYDQFGNIFRFDSGLWP
jgi:hypothetical protein